MDYVSTLSPDLVQKAKEKLGEDENRRQQDLQAIRDWLKKQPHLNTRTDAKYLLNVLRGCKFSLEKAKTKIDLALTLKTALPEFFSGWDAFRPEIQEILNIGVILPLPGFDQHGRKVIVFRPAAHDPGKHKIEHVCQTTFMVWEVMTEECEEMSISGLVLVADMRAFSVAHVTQVPLAVNKKLMRWWQDALPSRPQAFQHIYTSTIVHTFYNMISGFMNEQMRQRVKMHGEDLEEFYKDVSKTVLPKDYGGDNMDIAELTQYWKRKVEDKRDWLLEQEKYKADESKRPGKPKTSQDLFGIEGSFRKLEID